ncbi:MAG TPA: MmgE/PrpD family protein [Burkholderiales bacterium]|nr:MmgE/PrpD family protein [Burkholderiales bacterium]
MSVTEQLARFAIEAPADILTPEVLESAKAKFLDTIGVMVRGAQHPAGKIARDTVADMGGRPVATVLGNGERISSPLAGFANGVSAHALEYDDNTRGVGHASVVLVPGCLAVAEETRASGRAMLEAFAVGFEVTARIARGLRPHLLDRGWHPIGIVGGQGVAVAACRLMDLGTPAARMAMGIMASSGSGVRKNVGSMGKAFHVGHGVRCGIFAASLARRGYTVDPDVIEGQETAGDGHERFGLADTYTGVGNYRLQLMTEGLGTTLELARNTTMVRMHPGSTAPAAAVDGLIELVSEHALNAGDVAEIRVECTPQCVAIAPYAEPSDEHRAKFCIPYTLAVAFLDRDVRLAQYHPQRIADEAVHALMKRVTVIVPEDLKRHRGQWGENGVNWGESRVSVLLKDGRRFDKSSSYAKGWPERPATSADLKHKYEECTGGLFSRAQIDETVQMIAALEKLDKVGELTRALVPRPR